jgi:hypothetical protein
MAVKLMNQNIDQYAKATTFDYLCDTDDDFASLPETTVGSTAVSIASGTVKVVNTKGQWVTFGG